MAKSPKEMRGGVGRRLHAHEVVKLAMRKLVLTSSTPRRCAFTRNNILFEQPHLRQGKIRAWDQHALGKTMYQKDTVMGIDISSVLANLCLHQSTSKSSDFVRRQAENSKFAKDARSVGHIQNIEYIPYKRACGGHRVHSGYTVL